MSSPVRPYESTLSRWQGRTRVLEIRERWRVFCDAQVRRLNSPDPVGIPAREAAGAGDELAAVLPEGRVVVIDSPGGPGVEGGGASMRMAKPASLVASAPAAAARAVGQPTP